MTFNIHGGRPAVGPVDLEAIADVIRRLKPDLVGLQEVHCYLPPPYAFRDQPRRLRTLTGMELAFGRALGLGPVAYGNAILSRTPVTARSVPLPITREWKGLEPRGLMEARVMVGEQAIHFLNTHLGLTAAQRGLQAQRIAGRATRILGPMVLAGDLNAVEDSAELRILGDAGLRDCATPGVLTFPADTPRCRIDHLLVSRHFEVERCFAEETRVSDHRPLIADLVLRD
jgi:endonuclease/exonuclease/phosphatase family metal-dependent hydrolase